MYKTILKPAGDTLVSMIVLVITLPLTCIALIFLTWQNRGKCFFIQRRPGKNGVLFNIWKFKTMTDAKDTNGNLLPDADRLTPVGKFIRKTSLDEIPQLFNVIKGEMSLIGPRPLLEEYLDKYTPEQNRRHEVKPGITGWAQVNGRNAISWEEKFKLDVWYVDHQSFGLDLRILLMTVVKVFKAEGISAQNHATADKFEGYT